MARRAGGGWHRRCMALPGAMGRVVKFTALGALAADLVLGYLLSVVGACVGVWWADADAA